MFDFLKSKKKAEPIYSDLVVDMHNHLIPKVDDGSNSAQLSLDCMNAMYEVGFTHIYITPHFQYPRYPNDEEEIKKRFEQLKQDVSEKTPLTILGVGGEYRIDDGFNKRMEEQRFLQVGKQNKFLLVELSLHQPRMGVAEVIFDLQMKGYEIILAHPERYPYLNITSTLLEKLKEQGVFFQSNILSLSGFYGDAAQSKAFEYIESDWVEFLGTDMHNAMYAQALRDSTHNKRVQKLMGHHKFMNAKELL